MPDIFRLYLIIINSSFLIVWVKRAIIKEGIQFLRDYKTKQAEKSFMGDAGRLWNQALREIKESPAIAIAKRMINLYCKMLPI